MFNKILAIALSSLLIFTLGTGIAFGAPSEDLFRTILPETDSTYDLGSNSVRWANGYFDNFDSTTGTIGTLVITSLVDGDLIVNGNIIQGDGTGTATSTIDTLANGNIVFSTNSSSSALVIENNGNIGAGADLVVQDDIFFGGSFLSTSTESSYIMGSLGIGTTTPTNMVEIEKDTNAGLFGLSITNPNSGSSAFTNFSLKNGYSYTESLRFDVFGTGFTTSGSNIQDGARIGTGAGLTGGLSFAVSSGDIRFFTNLSTQSMTIASTDNVGIGTTTPAAKLHVVQTGSDPSFIVEDSASPDSTRFIVDTHGNVGIGTTTPSRNYYGSLPASLDVWGGTGVALMTFHSTSGNANGITLGIEGYDTSQGGIDWLISERPDNYRFSIWNQKVQEKFSLLQNGYLGISNTTPTSTLQVGTPNNSTSTYLQIDSEAGAPASGDCDSNEEQGKVVEDHTNDRVYICNVLSGRGWDHIDLID